MAVIKTGLLIDVKGSVGGVNLYKRSGVPCMRNKPVRSESYVSSPAQMYQQSVFKLVADFARSSSDVVDLIRGGWGAPKKGKGRSGFNNFTSKVLKLLSRDETGAKVNQAAYEANVNAFESNPGGWLHVNVPLTDSKFPAVTYDLVPKVTGATGSKTLTFTVPVEVLNDWLRTNARQYGTIDDPNQVVMYLGGAILGSTATEWYKTVTPTSTSGVLTFTASGDFDETAESLEVSLAMYPAASGKFGAPNYPAITQRVALAVDMSVTRAAAKKAE